MRKDDAKVVAILSFKFTENSATPLSGSPPPPCVAKATLTCSPGCDCSMSRITITKDGKPIGDIYSMTCGPGNTQTSMLVELSECGANDLSGGFLIQCSDTETKGGSFDYNIPYNKEPWGVEILASGKHRIIGN